MDYFDVIADMKKRIQVEIECGKRNFAIYPFGVGGMMAKNVLETCFGITPCVIDNKLCSCNPGVFSMESIIMNGGG